MLLIAALILFLLALINYRIGGSALFYPAVVFCLVWAVDILLVWAVGDFFYPMAPQTLVILVSGACALSVGSAIAFLYPQQPGTPQDGANRPIGAISNRLISSFVLFEFLCLPLAVRWMLNQASDHPSLNFFLSMSRTMADDDVKATLGYTLFANLVLFSNVTATLAFFERENHLKRWRIAFALALGLNATLAARGAVVSLFLSLLCLDWLRTRRIPWKPLMASVAALFVFGSAIAIYLGKVGADPNASIADNAVPVLQGLAVYTAGSTVAFDQIVRDPARQGGDSMMSLFLARTVNKFGARLEEPDSDTTGPGFLELGPQHVFTNVYTIYGTYMDCGYPGMVAIMVFLGMVIAACYRRALPGNRIASLFYALLFTGLVLSTFADPFFYGLNYMSKFYVLALCVYALPSVWSAGRRFLGRSVERRLARPESEIA